MEKLIIQSKGAVEEGKVIRIDAEAVNLLDALSMQTGRPVSYLASEMVKFASKYVEIQTVKVDFRGEAN